MLFSSGKVPMLHRTLQKGTDAPKARRSCSGYSGAPSGFQNHNPFKAQKRSRTDQNHKAMKPERPTQERSQGTGTVYEAHGFSMSMNKKRKN